MVTPTGGEERIWEILRTVPDPEIPVISLVDLGVVRSVRLDGPGVEVVIRPTFSGCPALQHMRDEVERALREQGYEPVTVTIDRLSSWSTNALHEAARQRLLAFGIAPPPVATGDLSADLAKPVACPQCGSSDTVVDSAFGPTLCKQIFRCKACRQSFERFKPLG
ncbi:MAG: phenylacetate-CoA oxygenase subunit PaaJ [Bacteroidetes bacterium]|jgi:ring-1,2-phenylacetyl-CoA epoxidase subunit PaaD|nr:phenylacetate-CoA oxygenase subunit PaaJ [Bacteroidota bacterium]